LQQRTSHLFKNMKYKYIVTEESLDVRHFEILSDKKLDEEEILDALCLPNITKEGNVVTQGGIKSTFLRTEFGDDSEVKAELQSFKHVIKLIHGGK